MQKIQPFHLAIPVHDIELCRAFYANVLHCTQGRYDEKWVDFNFFGHQLVIHLKPSEEQTEKPIANPVDGHTVPVPHFGVVLEWNEWHALVAELKEKEIQFIIEPYIRFEGKVGEQATMFFNDPSGNALEFKAFKNPDQLFAS